MSDSVAAPVAAPRLSPATLGLVVLAHLGGLAAVVFLRVAPAPPASNALMVEVLRADVDTAVPAPRTLHKSVQAPGQAPAIATSAILQPPAQAPILDTESSQVSSTSDVPRTEKTLLSAQLPAAPQSLSGPNANTAPEQSAPRFDAAYLQNPAPVYPPLAQRAGEAGTVVLKVYVEPSGAAGQVEVHQGSGFARLDRSACAAVSRWKFVPAKHGVEAIGAWVLVPIVFSLKG